MHARKATPRFFRGNILKNLISVLREHQLAAVMMGEARKFCLFLLFCACGAALRMPHANKWIFDHCLQLDAQLSQRCSLSVIGPEC